MQAEARADAHDRRQDEELAAVLSNTEIMVLKFHQSSGLSQRRGQALLDLLRHPEFDIKDVQSTPVVHLLRRLERPLKECAVSTYKLWKPGDGNQRLELVIRDGVQRNYARSTMAGAVRPHVLPYFRCSG